MADLTYQDSWFRECPPEGLEPWKIVPSDDRPLDSWLKCDQMQASIRALSASSHHYHIGSILGSGGWGTVYKVRRVSDGRVLAGKISKANSKLSQEANALQSLDHENILKYVDWYPDPLGTGSNMLLTELCARGTLQARIDHFTITQTEVLQVTGQIARALDYLHSRDIFHSDVKPFNIFVKSLDPIRVVLGDCADIARVESPGARRGTPNYWSPTLAQTKRYCGKSDDTWALGVTILAMLHQLPLRSVQDGIETEPYPQRCLGHAEDLARLNQHHGVVMMLRRILTAKNSQRATARDVVNLSENILQSWKMEDEFEGVAEHKDIAIITPEHFEAVSFW